MFGKPNIFEKLQIPENRRIEWLVKKAEEKYWGQEPYLGIVGKLRGKDSLEGTKWLRAPLIKTMMAVIFEKDPTKTAGEIAKLFNRDEVTIVNYIIEMKREQAELGWWPNVKFLGRSEKGAKTKKRGYEQKWQDDLDRIRSYAQKNTNSTVGEIADALGMRNDLVEDRVRFLVERNKLEEGTVENHEERKERRIKRITELLKQYNGNMNPGQIAVLLGREENRRVPESTVADYLKTIRARREINGMIHTNPLRSIPIPMTLEEKRAAVLSEFGSNPDETLDEIQEKVGLTKNAITSVLQSGGGRTELMLRTGKKPWESRKCDANYLGDKFNRNLFFLWLTAEQGYLPDFEKRKIYAPPYWKKITCKELARIYPPFNKMRIYAERNPIKTGVPEEDRRAKGVYTVFKKWQQSLDGPVSKFFYSLVSVIGRERIRKRDLKYRIGAARNINFVSFTGGLELIDGHALELLWVQYWKYLFCLGMLEKAKAANRTGGGELYFIPEKCILLTGAHRKLRGLSPSNGNNGNGAFEKLRSFFPK